ncbi:MAG: cytochrome b, partial [Alphaproteobacteria bacterium]|nr:cytochrome b [Alphaproteobacteria bacterium]
IIGESIVSWLWGGFAVGGPTLNRFYALHYLFPFLIVAIVGLHLIALHQHRSNNPIGIEPTKPKDCVPFHPFYTIKDLFCLGVFALVLSAFIFFMPNFFGEAVNYDPANPLVTPAHIVPEWYFLPYYAILRAVPSKLGGVVLMFASVFVLFVVPWLDTCKVKSARYRPLYRIVFWTFLADCIVLGWVGANPPEGYFILIGRLATVYYFAFFVLFMPLLGKFERTLPVPESFDAAKRCRL